MVAKVTVEADIIFGFLLVEDCNGAVVKNNILVQNSRVTGFVLLQVVPVCPRILAEIRMRLEGNR